MKQDKHTPEEWWIDDDNCVAMGHGDDYKTIAEVIATEYIDLIAFAPTLQARIDRFKDELKVNINAMNAASAKIDRLEAEKAELVELLRRLDAWARHSMEIYMEQTSAALAKTETVEGRE